MSGQAAAAYVLAAAAANLGHRCQGVGPSGDSAGSAPAPSAYATAALSAAAAADAAARDASDGDLTADLRRLLDALGPEDREVARELDMAQTQIAAAQVQYASARAHRDAAQVQYAPVLAHCDAVLDRNRACIKLANFCRTTLLADAAARPVDEVAATRDPRPWLRVVQEMDDAAKELRDAARAQTAQRAAEQALQDALLALLAAVRAAKRTLMGYIERRRAERAEAQDVLGAPATAGQLTLPPACFAVPSG